MGKSINLQDVFLNQCRKEGVAVTVYLTNSVQLRGMVKGFDAFTVLLEAPGKVTQLVYKHAIASVVPQRPVNTHRPDFRQFEGAPVEEEAE
ncbi:MAG: RNA chaperone Hfq [Fimbriimonadaceae bacterium]